MFVQCRTSDYCSFDSVINVPIFFFFSPKMGQFYYQNSYNNPNFYLKKTVFSGAFAKVIINVD